MKVFPRRRHRGPAKLREQPDGGLLDKLVFGVGVRHGLKHLAYSKEELLKEVA